MSQSSSTQTDGVGPDYNDLRATYEEYDVGDARLAMIADEEDEHAWIQSDVFVGVEQ